MKYVLYSCAPPSVTATRISASFPFPMASSAPPSVRRTSVKSSLSDFITLTDASPETVIPTVSPLSAKATSETDSFVETELSIPKTPAEPEKGCAE